METNLEVKKKNILKYNAWNEHLNNTRERTNYSIRRMDLLVISICGAGIYIIFETLREFKINNKVELENSTLLLISGILFMIAIILNFVSQKTGYYSNNDEEKYIIIELTKLSGGESDDCEQDRLDRSVKRFNVLTDILNISSILLMLIGLILLAIFNFNLF